MTTMEISRSLENFVIIWLDATLKTKNIADYVAKESHDLRRIVKNLKLYIDPDSCIKYMMNPQIQNQRIFLIVSGSLGQDFVPRVHSIITELYSIYVFCSYVEKHEKWAKSFNKIKGVSKDLMPICEQLKHDVFQCSNDLRVINISATKEETLLTYNQFWKELEFINSEETKMNLMNDCQHEYIDHEFELEIINKNRYSATNESRVGDNYTELLHVNIDPNAKWIQDGVTVAGGNGNGSELNQLSFPFGLYVDDDQTIYTADVENDRIMAWKYGATSGHLIAGGNGEGKQSNQLNSPTDVTIDKKTDNLIICDWQNQRIVQWPRQNGTNGETIISDVKCRGITMDDRDLLYVTNWEKNEVRLWQANKTCRTVIAGGNGEGNRLDQLSFPTYVCVGPDHSVYVSDWNNHRVIKWIPGAKEGIIVAGGQGQGDALTQLSYPFGLAVDQLGTIYVVDSFNHRVMRWCKDATQGTILVGGNGEGGQRNQLNFPIGLAFDQQGNLYIGDKNNHRIQRFSLHRHY